MPVLEVGPGTGVLTRFLLDEGHQLSVVELDTESIDVLRREFPALDGKGRIIYDDFLKMKLDALFDTKFCVTGNYPYNISSQIFFKVLEYREQVICCSGMIQKEVAERLAAKPSSRNFGILAALVQPWYDVEYLLTVEAEVFEPPPKVRSAVIRMRRNSRTALGCDETLYRTVVKTAFNQRRKTLRNSLNSLIPKQCPVMSQPLFGLRPEQIDVERFIEITKIVENYGNTNS
jgi:16S rRNA (adenine1518-N6/adenine1519-N6)-dimethyltransferase